MIIKPIEPQRLYIQIADQLRKLIDEKKIPVGKRLPPERELARQLAVSRPSLREALIALEVEGRVEIRMGSGVFVCEPTAERHNGSRTGATRAIDRSPLEVMRARALIETAIIAQIIPAIRSKDIQSLKAIVLRMKEKADDPLDHLNADREFHIYLAGLTKNSVLTSMISELFDDRFSAISEKFNQHFQTYGAISEATKEHDMIVHALEAKDGQLAQAAMQMHLNSSYDRMVISINDRKRKKPDISSS